MDATSGEAPTWPPAGDPVHGINELPEPATAAYRLPWLIAGYVGVLPVLLLFASGRLVTAANLPPSRLLNPGLGVVLAVVAAVLVAVTMRSTRRLMVAGGSGWVARRLTPWSRFRVVRFADLTTFSVRTVATRGGRRRFLMLVSADGQHTGLSVPAVSACGPALVSALRDAGVPEVPPSETRRGTGRQALTITAVVLAIALLPMGYLLAGPFRVLPDPIAGWFSSSGCRAALAAELQTPSTTRLFMQAREAVGGEPWSLRGDYPMSIGQYVDGTADPADRRAHLESYGLRRIDQVEYVGPAGQILAVQTLDFATPAGAASYQRYVNRATCERFAGSAGPAPTEVVWHGGRGYGMVRWVSGSTVYDVSPTMTTPRATGRDAELLAATLLGSQPA